MRDGHAEISAEFDLFLIAGTDPTAVAVASEAEVGEIVERLQSELTSQTRLFADDTEIPLRSAGFPSALEVRAMSAMLSASGQPHGERVRLRFEALRAVPHVAKISVVFPKSLGPVVVSMTQPQVRYVSAGDTAAFLTSAVALSNSPESDNDAVGDAGDDRSQSASLLWPLLAVAALFVLVMLAVVGVRLRHQVRR